MTTTTQTQATDPGVKTLDTDRTEDFILALTCAVHAGKADKAAGVSLHAHPHGFIGAAYVMKRLSIPAEYVHIRTRGGQRKAIAAAYYAAHFGTGDAA